MSDPIISKSAFVHLYRTQCKAMEFHTKAMEPHKKEIARIESEIESAAIAAGFSGTPELWCEFCGAPFDFNEEHLLVIYEDGPTSCLRVDDKDYPPYCKRKEMAALDEALGEGSSS